MLLQYRVNMVQLHPFLNDAQEIYSWFPEEGDSKCGYLGEKLRAIHTAEVPECITIVTSGLWSFKVQL